MLSDLFYIKVAYEEIPGQNQDKIPCYLHLKYYHNGYMIDEGNPKERGKEKFDDISVRNKEIVGLYGHHCKDTEDKVIASIGFIYKN